MKPEAAAEAAAEAAEAAEGECPVDTETSWQYHESRPKKVKSQKRSTQTDVQRFESQATVRATWGVSLILGKNNKQRGAQLLESKKITL